jgi:hypothetical protein
MSFFRSLLFLCLVSLFAAAFLLFLGSVSGNGGYRGGYAVLSAGDSLDDRNIRSLLDAGKNFAGSPVSESSQWVIIDEFGSLETVPLDKFSARINSFDPRNDGYAEKLKNVFVRDGKRFFYIPLKAGNSVPSRLDRQFKELLGDISFSVEYFGIGKPFLLFFIAYAAACAALIVICYAKKFPHTGYAFIIALSPVLSCLAFFGSAGIACAALFLGIFFMLREPFNELVTLFFLKERFDKKKNLIIKNAVEPYRIYWLFLPVFAAALGLIAFFSRLNVFFLLAVFIASCALYFLSARTLSFLGGKHTRFTPVQILRRRFVDFSFSTYMLPHIAAAFLVMFISPYMGGALVSDGEFSAFVEEKDYYAHLAFQSSFSTRQLGESGAAYPGFILDKDGLPSVDTAKSAALVNIKPEQFPPFPLKNLMDFLAGVNNGGKMKRTGRGAIAEELSLLVLLVFVFPGLLLNGKISFPQRGQFSDFSRFTGKFFSQKQRWKIGTGTDKTRKKVLLYNSGNDLQLRKDA